ncbi:hypothetical protein FBEOM_5399 [Fusarium beomiforme]|uniref:Uncharacterized protein n=1 Tax=Fusarium beomiforme TaxID=44412 RepID=A0A9P5AL39_9HYPO|nr:hypothetical protein FBEOM_5399 [Fusarium beomiforme]
MGIPPMLRFVRRELLWLWSGAVYGVVTIFTSRAVATGMSGNSNKMGFSQLVPLTLLEFPVFAAMESHVDLDYQEKLKQVEKAKFKEANLGSAHINNSRPRPICLSLANIHEIPAQADPDSDS